MRLRIIAISFLLAVASTGASWLTLQPTLATLIDYAARRGTIEGSEVAHRVRAVLPYNLVLDLIIVSALVFLVVQYTVGRPLRRTEDAMDRLSRLELDVSLDSGGPLLARMQRAVARLIDSLQTERALTRRQLAALQEANEKLVRAQAELLATDRLATVGKLAAGVAHEVGNPLSGILGYLSLLRSRAATAEQTEMLQLIENEVSRIDQIVRSLLDLGRAPTGRAGPVEVRPVLEAVVKLLGKSPEMKSVEVQLQVPPSLFVLAEAGGLSQVLINLVINAAQAMAGQGRIVVSGRQREREVELTVRDSGPGIASDVLPRLFEPFFTTKAAGKGTGLGLAVSQHLVSGLQGSIRADNHPEGGAQFTVTLPAP